MSRYIVAYDVSDDRDRERVAAILLGVGMRLQRSVFEVETEDLDRLMARLEAAIDPDTDVVNVFPQCSSCEGRSRELGQAGPSMRAPWWVA